MSVRRSLEFQLALGLTLRQRLHLQASVLITESILLGEFFIIVLVAMIFFFLEFRLGKHKKIYRVPIAALGVLLLCIKIIGLWIPFYLYLPKLMGMYMDILQKQVGFFPKGSPICGLLGININKKVCLYGAVTHKRSFRLSNFV